MHSLLFVVGMGSLWTNVTFRTYLRVRGLRSTVWASSAQLLWYCTWIRSGMSLLLDIIATFGHLIHYSYTECTECGDANTCGALIRGPAGYPLHIGLSCSPRIRAEGSPCAGFTLAGCSSSGNWPLSACRAEDGRSRPAAPETGRTETVGVVREAWKIKVS